MRTQEATQICTILVVDDDPAIRHLLRDYLGDRGYHVVLAGDGRSMMECCATHNVDLILLDLNLPDNNGLSIARKLREHSSVPIIILTGQGEEVDRIIGLEMGADDYVAKPFSPRELLARIKAVLRRAMQPFAGGSVGATIAGPGSREARRTSEDGRTSPPPADAESPGSGKPVPPPDAADPAGLVLSDGAGGDATAPLRSQTAPGPDLDAVEGLSGLSHPAGLASSAADPVQRVRFAGWELNLDSRKLYHPESGEVSLTNGEFSLLAAFLRRPGRILSRAQLLEMSRIHDDEVFDRSIDVQILRLRRKLEADPRNPEIVRTERGVGYIFSVPVERL
jgi:DNA-binding response OmpR family regulator